MSAARRADAPPRRRALAAAAAALLAAAPAALLAAAPACDGSADDVIEPGVLEPGVLDGACTGGAASPRVLVYSYENMWRHISSYHARSAVFDMCTSRGFDVQTTNDPHTFNDAQLAGIDVVVFGVTSGSGLPASGRAALEAWVRAGGGIVGLHSASATESDWPFFVATIGAQFAGHVGGLQAATVRIEPGPHPITQGLAALQVTDEWYWFQERPESVPGLQVLLALDEDTLPPDYPAEAKLGYHAIGWTHEATGGRMFYTAMGHNPDVFGDATFLDLLGRAIEWAGHHR